MKSELITFSDAMLLVWELTESIETLKEQLNLVDSDNIALEKIVSEKRKLEFLGIRVAFKTLLGKEIEIEYDGNGKPSLKDKSYQISISHSKNWIVVMAHPNRLVGIDIECPTDKIQKLYKRFLGIDEQKDLSNGKDNRQLLLAWSGKEALYKIIGNEAVDFANQLRIFPFVVKPSGEIKAEHIPTNTFYRLIYQLTQNYTLVYCLA